MQLFRLWTLLCSGLVVVDLIKVFFHFLLPFLSSKKAPLSLQLFFLKLLIPRIFSICQRTSLFHVSLSPHLGHDPVNGIVMREFFTIILTFLALLSFSSICSISPVWIQPSVSLSNPRMLKFFGDVHIIESTEAAIYWTDILY